MLYDSLLLSSANKARPGRVQKIVGGVTQFRNTILLFYKHIIPHETYATELSRVRKILKFLVGEKQKIFEALQLHIESNRDILDSIQS